MRTGKIHAAKLANSNRLQSVLSALREEGPVGLTTRQLIQKTGMCAINSIVDELRENGVRIDGGWDPRVPGREKAFRYRLVPPVAPAVIQRDLFGNQAG